VDYCCERCGCGVGCEGWRVGLSRLRILLWGV
jgi:hypothetical protein